MGRPPSGNLQTTIKLPPEMVAELDAIAAAMSASRVDVIRMGLKRSLPALYREWVGELPPPPPAVTPAQKNRRAPSKRLRASAKR